MIRVLFFAQLREQLRADAMSVSITDAKTLGELKAFLLKANPDWKPYFFEQTLLIAVNHTYVKTDTVLHDGDEVAFFPPVTGG